MKLVPLRGEVSGSVPSFRACFVEKNNEVDIEFVSILDIEFVSISP